MRWPPSADADRADHAGGPDDVDTVATLRAVRAAVLAYGLGRFDDALDLLAGTPRDGLSATAATVVRLRRAQFTLWHRGPAAARSVLAETGPYDPRARHHAGAGAGAEVSALALTGRAGEAVRRWDEPLPEWPGGGEIALVLALTEARGPDGRGGAGREVLRPRRAGPPAARAAVVRRRPRAHQPAAWPSPAGAVVVPRAARSGPPAAASGCPWRWPRAA